MKLVKCNKCKWVHFEIDPKPDELGRGCIKCFRCGNDFEDFSDADEGDVPNGSTVQAIKPRRIK